MSSTTLAHKGLEAVRNRDYAAAIPLLDKALERSDSPAWLLARAQAHQQLKNYDAALQDAELAYHIAAERGSGNSRKQMIEAQYRRATVYHKLGRYADSDCCAKWSMLLAEGRPAREDDGVEKKVDETGRYTVTYKDAVADKANKPGNDPSLDSIPDSNKTGFEADWNRAYVWRSQTLGAMDRLPADHPGRIVNVKKIPVKPVKKKAEPKPEEKKVTSSHDEPVTTAKKEPPAPGSVPVEKMKTRVDFYQSNTNVTVTLFVKDVKKDTLKVDFGKQMVRISPLPREAAPYVKPDDKEATSTLLLSGEIDPVRSRWTVTPRKVELVLQKATPGAKWATWGEESIGDDLPGLGETQPAAQVENTPPAAAPKESTAQAPKPAGGSLPTPYTSKKDWNKLEDEEEDENKNDINYFFKKLYKDVSPEQQRAMMKSFVESNGTALSTDWNDVKNRKVETVPPEGVEPKKWTE